MIFIGGQGRFTSSLETVGVEGGQSWRACLMLFQQVRQLLQQLLVLGPTTLLDVHQDKNWSCRLDPTPGRSTVPTERHVSPLPVKEGKTFNKRLHPEVIFRTGLRQGPASTILNVDKNFKYRIVTPEGRWGWWPLAKINSLTAKTSIYRLLITLDQGLTVYDYD